MSIMSVNIPFTDSDCDEQSVDGTGGTIAALFTNLDFTICRQILIYNAGAANILYGKNSAGAKFPIPPGSSLTLALKDLAKGFLKAASGTQTVDVLAIY